MVVNGKTSQMLWNEVLKLKLIHWRNEAKACTSEAPWQVITKDYATKPGTWLVYIFTGGNKYENMKNNITNWPLLPKGLLLESFSFIALLHVSWKVSAPLHCYMSIGKFQLHCIATCQLESFSFIALLHVKKLRNAILNQNY